MPARLSALLVGSTLCVLAVGSASSLTVSAWRLGAGTAAVSPCDADGFSFRYTIDTSGRITTVNVGGIAAACAGGTLQVTLTAGSTSVGSGVDNLPSSGFSGSASVSISATPLSSLVTANYADVEGP